MKNSSAIIVTIATLVIKTIVRLGLIALVIAAILTCVCCFDPDQPGAVCDRPDLFMASATIGGAALFALFMIR